MIKYRCHNRERTCSPPPCQVSSRSFFARRWETGESGGRTGCLTSSETGALPIRPPTLTIPFMMIGSRGASLLLFVRQPLPDSRDAISKAQDLAWIHRTIVISASWRSSALNENIRGSEPTFLLKECCKPSTARSIKATNLRNLNQCEKLARILRRISFPSFLAEEQTTFFSSGSLSSTWWEFGWSGHSLSGPQRKLGPLFHPLTLKQCFPIKASWGVICWIELWWHVVPLLIIRQLMGYRHSVGDEGVKPCLLVLHIAEDRCAIAPEITVFQRKCELWTKLLVNLGSNYGTGQFHPWDGHLFERGYPWLATIKAAVDLIILVDET